jgi:hypothetical protein
MIADVVFISFTQSRYTKAARGRARTPKASAKQDEDLNTFRTQCFWSAMRPRIAFILGVA